MQTVNQFPQILADVTSMQPSVSILLPFEPHLRPKAELLDRLDAAINKVTRQIQNQYDNDLGKLVLQKLKKVIRQLNFNTFKKSVAICVSPVFEKIIYLSFPVEERVVINTHFNIRRIIRSKKEDKTFLLVNLSRYASSIYLGDEKSLLRLNANNQKQKGLPPVPDFPSEKSFTDRNDLREELLKDFLRKTDQSLGVLLRSYPLPVFVTGSPKTIGEFKNISAHTKSIVRYIHGHYADSPVNMLKEMLEPVLQEWHKIKGLDQLQRIRSAADSRRLAIGIRDVWKQAKAHNASLLVVEEGFSPAAILQPLKGEDSYDQYSLVRNTVDDIIEKVLECGGDVEIVRPGTLSSYNPIVLIERYPSTQM